MPLSTYTVYSLRDLSKQGLRAVYTGTEFTGLCYFECHKHPWIFQPRKLSPHVVQPTWLHPRLGEHSRNLGMMSLISRLAVLCAQHIRFSGLLGLLTLNPYLVIYVWMAKTEVSRMDPVGLFISVSCRPSCLTNQEEKERKLTWFYCQSVSVLALSFKEEVQATDWGLTGDRHWYGNWMTHTNPGTSTDSMRVVERASPRWQIQGGKTHIHLNFPR